MKRFRWWAEFFWPKRWLLTEDRGEDGFWIVSRHRTSGAATMAISVDGVRAGVVYRVMHEELHTWFTSDDSKLSVLLASDETERQEP